MNNTGEYSFELKFIKRTLVETTSRYLDFLKKLGIQNASCYEIIENHILPIYKGDNWRNKVNQLLEYICYIKDNLSEYEIESSKRNNSDLNENPLKSLKMSVLIKTDRNEYLRPTDIYIPAIYGNSNELETLLIGIKDVYFVSSEYIIQNLIKINTDSEKLEKIKEWREFFIQFGQREII